MRALQVPQAIDQALRQGAALAVSISGGKDSQAMLYALAAEWGRHPEWTGDIFAVHADLGRAEWKGSEDHVRRICQEAGIRLEVVQRAKGDMVQRWQERMKQLEGTGKPFWSSSTNRYCTSDLKRDPINKHLRDYPFIVSAEGLRAQESSARAKKAGCEVRSRITTKSLKRAEVDEALTNWGGEDDGRLALTWRPILEWTEADVWEAIGSSQEDVDRRRTLYRLGAEEEALEGFPGFYAYVYGNERMSCALCVLASKGDLLNGARHNPELFATLLDMEETSGATFRQDLSLADLAAELEAEAAA